MGPTFEQTVNDGIQVDLAGLVGHGENERGSELGRVLNEGLNKDESAFVCLLMLPLRCSRLLFCECDVDG